MLCCAAEYYSKLRIPDCCATALDSLLVRSLMYLRALFLITATAAVIFMQFVCTQPCDAKFSSRRGLTRHHDGCPIYKTAAALRTEQRHASKVKMGARRELNRKRGLDALDEPVTLDIETVCVQCAILVAHINGF